jgi:hypothetical protein
VTVFLKPVAKYIDLCCVFIVRDLLIYDFYGQGWKSGFNSRKFSDKLSQYFFRCHIVGIASVPRVHFATDNPVCFFMHYDQRSAAIL